jgi:hypothetical protein
MILSVHHFRAHGPNRWTHSRAGTQSWDSLTEATREAVAWAQLHGGVTGMTGHADREVLRAAGIPYLDSRGNDRRGKGSVARQRERFRAKLIAKGILGPEEPLKRAPAEPAVIYLPEPPAPPPLALGPVSTPAVAAISRKKAEALKAARAKRAVAHPRITPEGYRSVEHFLDSVREHVGSVKGATRSLAAYLNVDEASVRRWIKREKIPLQPTLDAIAKWMLMQ